MGRAYIINKFFKWMHRQFFYHGFEHLQQIMPHIYVSCQPEKAYYNSHNIVAPNCLDNIMLYIQNGIISLSNFTYMDALS